VAGLAAAPPGQGGEEAAVGLVERGGGRHRHS
jgi:hypothetical protein